MPKSHLYVLVTSTKGLVFSHPIRKRETYFTYVLLKLLSKYLLQVLKEILMQLTFESYITTQLNESD